MEDTDWELSYPTRWIFKEKQQFIKMNFYIFSALKKNKQNRT